MEQTFFPVTRREAERAGVQYDSKKNKNAGFPSRLRELRKGKGVSQDVVSKELGVSKSTLGLWETGDTLPDAKAICDLSTYYGVSADYLLGKTRTSTTDIKIKKICESTGLSEKAIESLLHNCGTNNNDFVLALIDNLLCDEGWHYWQALARRAAYLQAQSEVATPSNNPLGDFSARLRAEVHNVQFPFLSKESNSTVEIPVNDAIPFYLDRAIKLIGDIVSKTVDEYGAHMVEGFKGMQVAPLGEEEEEMIRKKISAVIYAAQAAAYDMLSEDSEGDE